MDFHILKSRTYVISHNMHCYITCSIQQKTLLQPSHLIIIKYLSNTYEKSFDELQGNSEMTHIWQYAKEY